MIAYVQEDGKIIGGCYADSPDVLATITKVPDGCTAIYIDDSQYPDVWSNLGEYTIQSGVPVFTPISDDVKLANAQQAKIAELTEAESNANPTFVSSALGTSHTYLSDEKAMGKFNAEYAYVNSPAYDGQPIKWYTIEEGGVLHTKEQFNQVWLDGRSVFAASFDKWDRLVKQVKACTTVDQVNAIKW
jgi:hypothetical protein